MMPIDTTLVEILARERVESFEKAIAVQQMQRSQRRTRHPRRGFAQAGTLLKNMIHIMTRN
jgi:hypothetical protein